MVTKSGGGVSLERREDESANAGACGLIGGGCDEVFALQEKSGKFEGGVEGAVEVEPFCLLAGEGLQLDIDRGSWQQEQERGEAAGGQLRWSRRLW